MARVRVVWREEEEERLLQLLTSLVDVEHVQGGRLDPMHLTQLHNEMEVSFPGRGIGAHIVALKIRSWKDDFVRLSELLNFAGIGWDANENRIIVEDAFWHYFIQERPRLAQFARMRDRQFPYFNRWAHCFGGDQADNVDFD